MESISEQQSEETRDGSVKGRVQAWETAWAIALDRPFLGGGFRALWNTDLWLRYYGDDFMSTKDAHSIFFEVVSEHGFVGLTLYLAVLCSTLLTLRRIRRRWCKHPEYGYLSNYAEMTQLCLGAYLAAGTFLGVAYFDLYWNLVAMSFTLFALSAEAIKATAEAAGTAQAVAPGSVPGRRRLNSAPRRAPAPAATRRRNLA